MLSILQDKPMQIQWKWGRGGYEVASEAGSKVDWRKMWFIMLLCP